MTFVGIAKPFIGALRETIRPGRPNAGADIWKVYLFTTRNVDSIARSFQPNPAPTAQATAHLPLCPACRSSAPCGTTSRLWIPSGSASSGPA